MGTADRSLIFLGGEPVPLSRWEGLVPGSLLIACDSGTMLLLANGLYPHVFIGDLDSLEESDISQIKPHLKEFLPFPREKDKTDSELGVEYAINAGAEEIVLIGGLGKRIDHTLANILLLLKIQEAGKSGYILDAKQKVSLLPDHFLYEGHPGLMFSLVPLSKTEKITISGAHFPLINGEIKPGNGLGLSNFMEGNWLEIKKEGGPILLVLLD
jgi:thiamine pyrophosphokinase